eukprot:scaffold21404_cov32-Tisochrysis_lutea.AAC.3
MAGERNSVLCRALPEWLDVAPGATTGAIRPARPPRALPCAFFRLLCAILAQHSSTMFMPSSIQPPHTVVSQYAFVLRD